MPDYQFNTNLGPAQQQGTSLSDLIQTARGVQAYQQAEQINPLALQKAQMEIEQLKQTNPLAVRKATAETETAETGSKKATLGLTAEQAKIINENIGSVLNDERLVDPNPQKRTIPLIEARQRAIHSGVDPVMAEVMFAPYVDKALRDKNPTAVKDLMSGIKNTVQSGIGAANQQALQTPSLTTNAAGQLVSANPYSNKIQVLGGNQGQGVGGQVANPNFQTEVNPTGFSIGATKEQATQAINNYIGSVNALTDASKPGHIPTQEFIAKKLLTYLKDPAVNTGPIADVLAGKSNQASLNSKEQEVLKLIQQRIQNLNPRTDADAQSKKDAYGSFRLKKEALSDLVRQDLGNIQNQKLLANGTMKAAGDPSAPNLPAVVNFQSKYKEFSKDPVLMQYTGIVGTGNKAAIDEHDKAALRKLMTDNNLSSLEELEQKRKQLVEMSGAK